ncbi:g3691 [Coccomyxa elongata]
MTDFQHKSRHLLQSGMCVTTPQTNLGGAVLVNGSANLQSSSAACCQSCWGHTTAVVNGNGCNAWVWCGLPARCNNGYGTVYPYQQCTLIFQASLQLPQPGITVASDVGMSGFTSGWIPSYSQAISETPTLPGYTRYPGVDYKQFYDYACGDVTASNDYCQQSGTLQAVAQKCMGDQTCSGFTYMPSQSMGWLKGGSRVSLAAVQSLTFATPNPDSVLYTRMSS